MKTETYLKEKHKFIDERGGILLSGSRRKIIFSSLLLLCLILIGVSASASIKQNTVVVNSKEWRNVFLATIYAGLNDADIVYFSNLKEANLKSQAIPKSNQITVFEPEQDAVVKNFGSYLKVNGFSDYDVVSFTDYNDLQEKLWEDGGYKGFVLLDPAFGIEAIAVSPLLIEKRYPPLFATEQNIGSIKDLIENKDVIAVGHFPARVLSNIPDIAPNPLFADFPDQNVDNITLFFVKNYPKDWTVVIRGDRVLPEVLMQANPIFVYYGDIGQLAQTVKRTNATYFEAISGDLANLLSELETKVGKDLKFIMRYGRTVTNVEGMQGKILDLDTVYFDFPYTKIELVKAVYYPKHNVTAITFESKGNMNTLIFSNMEILGLPLSDSNMHSAPSQSAITIPYVSEVLPDQNNLSVVVTTQYDYRLPLRNTIKSESGNSFVRLPVVRNELFDDSAIVLKDYLFNNARGQIVLSIQNPTSHKVNVYAEFIFDDENIISSQVTELKAKSTQDVVIDTPYLLWSDIKGKSFTLNIYYGAEDTILQYTESIEITKVIETEGGFLKGKTVVFILIIIVVIVLVLFFIFWKKKGEGHLGKTKHVKF
ncbi:MAG: hypothetical protein V1659_02055 [Candidatus Woesearchaeota archaeon]